MTQPLRFAVVGAGGIAQMMHLPHLAERPDHYKVQALVDIDEQTLALVGDRYQVPTRTRDLQAVAADDIDAVLICASGNHREAIELACGAGKHVLVEKPMAYDLAEAETLAGVARQARGTFMVGYHKRFDPHYQRARDEIKSMRDLRHVDVSVLHPDDGAYRTHHVVWPNPDNRIPTATEADMRKGGAARVGAKGDALAAMTATCKTDAPAAHRMAALLATESLIHDINAVRGILGEPEEVISAHVWEDGWAQSSLSRFADDVRVNMSWVFLPGLRHYQETLRFVSPEKRVTLVFPSPYLRNQATELIIERSRDQELEVQHVTVSHEEAFAAELRHFRACVLENKRPELTEDDALADARFIRDLAHCYT